MGLFDKFKKKKEQYSTEEIEKWYADGAAFGFEEDVPIACNFVNEGNWHDAYFYIGSSEGMKLMENRYKPYFEFDWEEIAKKWNNYWRNRVVEIFFFKSNFAPSTHKDEGSYFHEHEEIKIFRKIVDELESFRPIPNKFIINGVFDRASYEKDETQYNPFVNFIMNHGSFDLSAKDLIALNNLYADNVINEEELLGIGNRILYNPSLYKDHGSDRICEIVAQQMNNSKAEDYHQKKEQVEAAAQANFDKNVNLMIAKQQQEKERENLEREMEAQIHKVEWELQQKQREMEHQQRLLEIQQKEKERALKQATERYKSAAREYNQTHNNLAKMRMDDAFADMMKYK